MKTVFADAGYWVAMLNPQDERSAAALETTRGLGDVQFVTTQEVLTEVLNFLSGFGPAVRRQAAEAIREILTAGNVVVIAPSPDAFLEGLEAYESPDAPLGTLTDCITASTMRQEGIEDVLTTDVRFGQSGFHVLMG